MFKQYDDQKQLEAFLSKNMDTLVKDFEEWIDYMQDSEEHKNYCRSSDRVFAEYVADKYYESLEAACNA